MLPPPAAHPFAMFRTAEVVPVGRLGQPLALAGRVAVPLAGGGAAVALAIAVSMIRLVEPATVLALPSSLALHAGEDAPAEHDDGSPAVAPARPMNQKRGEENGRRLLCGSLPKKTCRRKTSFTPAIPAQFHSGADSLHADPDRHGQSVDRTAGDLEPRGARDDAAGAGNRAGVALCDPGCEHRQWARIPQCTPDPSFPRSR